MKLGVDLIFMTGTKGGMETYVREVYRRLRTHLPDVELIGYASRQLAATGAPWFDGELVDTGVDGDDRISWARATLFGAGRRARRDGVDILHAPANFGPAGAAPPTVLTVHDLIAHRYPEYVPGRYAAVVRAMVSIAARRATRILTPSAATATDLRDVLHVPAERITVTPLAAAASRAVQPEGHADRQVLAVGNRMPHKNVEVLLEAVALLPAETRPRLVITGGRAGDPLPAMADRLGLGPDITIVGWLSDAELDALYRSSQVLALPTRFEGFGLPVLEAMARGVPVVCSDLPVLREVGGDAALYVDTTRPEALAAALIELLDDPAGQERRRRAGLARAATFTWDATAAATAEALHETVSEVARRRRR